MRLPLGVRLYATAAQTAYTVIDQFTAVGFDLATSSDPRTTAECYTEVRRLG